MKTILKAGLTQQEAEEVEADFRASLRLRQRLAQIIEDKMRAKRADVRKDEHYEKASWAYMQADAIGYERALSEIISIILSKSD